MQWEPKDITRLVALLGSLLLFILGAVMMWSGISAEGAIDIKSSILSGSVKTASAGLFICFLSFVIIVFVVFSLSHQSQAPNFSRAEGEVKPFKRIGAAAKITFLAFIVTGALASSGYGEGYGAMAFFLGCGLFFTGLVYVIALDEDRG